MRLWRLSQMNLIILLLMPTEKIPIWHGFVLCFVPIWYLLLSPWSTTKSQVKVSFCSTWLLGILAAPEKDNYRFFDSLWSPFRRHHPGAPRELPTQRTPGTALSSRMGLCFQTQPSSTAAHLNLTSASTVCSLMPTWQIGLISFWGETKLFKSQGKKNQMWVPG